MEAHIKEAVEQVTKDFNFDNCKIDVLSCLGSGDNYMGSLLRIEISGSINNEQATRNIIVKSAPKSQMMREKLPIAQLYKREINAYQTMLAEMEKIQNDYNLPEDERFKFIKCYKTGDIDLKEFVVMKDLTVSGFKLCSRKTALDFDHMKLVMKFIAYYHSLSFALKKHNPELYNEVAKDIKNDIVYDENYEIFINQTVRAAVICVSNSEHRKKLEDYAGKQYKITRKCIVPETCEPYNVFCHGDFWKNNILFQYKDGVPCDLRLVDWQMVKHCSPIVDISHLIFSATEESLRKDHYEELLELYYQTLTTTLARLDCDINQCYPKHIFQQQLKDILPYGFTFSMISLNMQMRDEEEVIDVEENLKKLDASIEVNYTLSKLESIKEFTNRIDGVVKDIINLGVI